MLVVAAVGGGLGVAELFRNATVREMADLLRREPSVTVEPGA